MTHLSYRALFPVRALLYWPSALACAGLAVVLALVLAGGVAWAGPGRAHAAPRIDDPGALAPFFAGLRRAEAGGADGRVAVVQLGDSHTAGDLFTAYLRHHLQERFGDAGRGFLLPGKPVRHYSPRDATYGSAGPWTVDSGLRQSPLFGIGGIGVRATESASTAWVGTCPACPSGQRVTHFEIFYRQSPSGGGLQWQLDDQPWARLSTRAPQAGPASYVVRAPEGDHRLTLRPAGDGEVDLFGVALERDAPGVVFDALGLVGAQAAHLYHGDFSLLGPQLARRDPRLLIVAYGTNEADQHHFDLDGFASQFQDLLRRLQKAVPTAGILVLGPPDLSLCTPGPTRGAACHWRTPAVLRDIILAEQRAARRTGAAFFDLFAAMGGAGRMVRFVQMDPRLAYPDHVHFTQQGYELGAGLLLTALLREYEVFRRSGGRGGSLERAP